MNQQHQHTSSEVQKNKKKKHTQLQTMMNEKE